MAGDKSGVVKRHKFGVIDGDTLLITRRVRDSVAEKKDKG